MCRPHFCYSWSEVCLIDHEKCIDVNFRQPGFEEFKNEAEVAFWTGILGEVLRSCILSVLTSAISFNFLFNAISDILVMGTSPTMFNNKYGLIPHCF